jgi:hypothetical protein
MMKNVGIGGRGLRVHFMMLLSLRRRSRILIFHPKRWTCRYLTFSSSNTDEKFQIDASQSFKSFLQVCMQLQSQNGWEVKPKRLNNPFFKLLEISVKDRNFDRYTFLIDKSRRHPKAAGVIGVERLVQHHAYFARDNLPITGTNYSTEYPSIVLSSLIKNFSDWFVFMDSDSQHRQVGDFLRYSKEAFRFDSSSFIRYLKQLLDNISINTQHLRSDDSVHPQAPRALVLLTAFRYLHEVNWNKEAYSLLSRELKRGNITYYSSSPLIRVLFYHLNRVA